MRAASQRQNGQTASPFAVSRFVSVLRNVTDLQLPAHEIEEPKD
jgi:hypothetical protein